MRSRTHRRRARRTHRTRRTHHTYRTHRRHGGGLAPSELRSKLMNVPVYQFSQNENKFNSKSFDRAKDWFNDTFHQVNHSDVWKSALWPRHVLAKPEIIQRDIMRGLIDDEKDALKSLGMLEAHTLTERVANFVEAFLEERNRKVKSDKKSFSRLFNPEERTVKYQKDAQAVKPFLDAVDSLFELSQGAINPAVGRTKELVREANAL